MSVHAGTILHLGGNNVIDRIQSAGLGDVRVPIETIREVGNELVVDKVAGEPDFTFTLETLDVSTDLMAFLMGATGGSASAAAPGAADPSGTAYLWENCEFVNIPSPWKDPTTGSAGTVVAGHLIPGYYVNRIRYRFGVTDNAGQEVELAGGAFYCGERAPVEEYATGNGVTTAFVTATPAAAHRKGGAAGTTFQYIFGVIVNGQLQTEGVDYTVSGGGAPGAETAVTITFTVAPANAARIRYSYFSTAAKSYPRPVHADSIIKPGAVRGRNIRILLGAGSASARVGSVQSVELEATIEGEVEREMGNENIVGRSVNGRDTTGTVVIRSKNKDAFFAVLSKLTGVARNEVFGWFNQNTIPLVIQIENPKNPGAIIKSLVVDDAMFQPPGTPARVNSPTDFSIRFDSKSGTFREVKGAYAAP